MLLIYYSVKQCKSTIKDNARTPLLSKSGKLTGLGKAIYDLISNGIKGTLRREAVSSTIGELCVCVFKLFICSSLYFTCSI